MKLNHMKKLFLSGAKAFFETTGIQIKAIHFDWGNIEMTSSHDAIKRRTNGLLDFKVEMEDPQDYNGKEIE